MVTGTFGTTLYPWPIVGIHAALLPDGDILTYGADTMGMQGSNKQYDIYDPSTGVHQVWADSLITNEFCSNEALDPTTGHMIIVGGDASVYGFTNDGVPDVNTLDWTTGTLSVSPTGHMQEARWYPTLVYVGNGHFLVSGGWTGAGPDPGAAPDPSAQAATIPELYTPGVGWQQLTGAQDPNQNVNAANEDQRWYFPRIFLSSNGGIFGWDNTSPDQQGQLFQITTAGNGSINYIGQTAFDAPYDLPAAMYSPDHILVLDPQGNAWIVDISGPTPTFTEMPGIIGQNRSWSNLVVLADGTVLLSGGDNIRFQDLGSATNTAMIWNPDTGQWTQDATANIARLYHSNTLLLPDGQVLSVGGGDPGPLTNLNNEIYTPAYLLNPDGSLRTDRPVITNAPKTLEQGNTFTISLDNASVINKLELIKYGDATHSFDAESDAIKLPFTQLDKHTLQITLPANTNLLTDGYWLLFADNNNGTPSVAATIKIGGSMIDVASPQLGTTMWIDGDARHLGENPLPANGFTLTGDYVNQVGAIMGEQKIDLTKNFDLKFSVLLGNTPNPADGMAFVLHNDELGKNAIGSAGGGLGAVGIHNGVGISFDSLPNDHTLFFETDNSKALSAGNAVTLSDGNFHAVDVSWNAATQTLSYTIDGQQESTLTGDLVDTYFGGSSQVWFGFTAATGGLSALHQVELTSFTGTYVTPLPAGVPNDGSIFDVSQIGASATVNGSASFLAQDGTFTNVFTLTPNAANQAGSAMLNNKVDLSHAFNMAFEVSFGPQQYADGMAFVLQNDPLGAKALGQGGAGKGAVGIQNGLAIEIDTLGSTAGIDTDTGMPMATGNAYTHMTSTATGQSVTGLADITGINDGGWHQVGVSWDPATDTLNYWIDGRLDGTYTGDILDQYLGGLTSAYVGFTGGTGAATDLQQVRVADVDAHFLNTLAYPEIQDASAAFNTIVANGSSAIDAANHAVVLTQNVQNQAGSAMLNQQIDLSHSFQISFDLLFGNNAADGVAFLLQNDPRGLQAIGAAGAGYGATGIQNGLGIAFDTLQHANDMAADHTDFFNTATGALISDELQIGTGNVKDGTWHNVIVNWNAASETLTYWFDGTQEGTLQQDIAGTYLGGSQYAYVGFSGGTGADSNLQEVRLENITAQYAAQTQQAIALDGTAVLNGSATYDAVNHNFILTPDAGSQAGSAILSRPIDLTHNFQATFDVYLGSNAQGADGIAFFLENDPQGTAALGGAAGNYGAVGIKNGLGIAFDTYQNAGEIAADHTDFFNTADGTVIGNQVPLGNGNIKDGNWHNVVVDWNAATDTLTETFDGQVVGNLASNIVATYLGGSQFADLGFSGGTGGFSNLQEVRLDDLTAQFAPQTTPRWSRSMVPGLC
jgi:hypothetical protein